RSKTVARLNLKALPDAFFLVARNAVGTMTTHRRHLEKVEDELAVSPIQGRATALAAVGAPMITIVEVAARIAELGLQHATFNAAWRQDAAEHTIFPAFMVDDITRPKFR